MLSFSDLSLQNWQSKNTVTGRNLRYVLDATNYETVEDIDLSKERNKQARTELCPAQVQVDLPVEAE